MSHYIKVKDTKGDTYTVDTHEETSGMTTDRALSIASVGLGVGQLALTFITKGKYKPKPKSKS